MSIEEIIAALEKATGPSRELDGAILTAICPDALITIYCVGDDEPIVFHAEPLVRNKMPVPHYTSSIDAALTLVPRDGSVSTITLDIWLDFNGGGNDVTDADLKRVDPEMDTVSLGRCSMAEHPALAVCIAALRARQVQS